MLMKGKRHISNKKTWIIEDILCFGFTMHCKLFKYTVAFTVFILNLEEVSSTIKQVLLVLQYTVPNTHHI